MQFTLVEVKLLPMVRKYWKECLKHKTIDLMDYLRVVEIIEDVEADIEKQEKRNI